MTRQDNKREGKTRQDLKREGLRFLWLYKGGGGLNRIQKTNKTKDHQDKRPTRQKTNKTKD